MITVLGSIITAIRGDLHDHLTNMRIFTLIVKYIFTSFEQYEQIYTLTHTRAHTHT